ncbi:hypothetical protein CSB37_00870 [bacterium DOLZORAL124_38_8]|nr:MAG: hypothetical protein CSB37_00870 [bacterium DOLZORAL124_38_8]
MPNLNLISVLIFAFAGACFGSFAGVVIDRLFADQDGIFWGRSRCEHTGKLLQWWEMIPIFSYLGLRGKSAHSGKPIPFWYLAMELTFAVVFGAFAHQFLPTILQAEYLTPLLTLGALFAALLLFFYDARHFLVDRRISFPAIALALGWALFKENTIDLLIGGAIGFSFYFAQWKISNGKWVGAGDQELGLFMGLLLGWKSLLWALLLSYILGSIIAIGMMVGNPKVGLKSALPMGAFLMPILILFLLYPQKIWALYDQYMALNDHFLQALF